MNDRLQHVEINSQIYSKQHDVSKLDEDTLVNDDCSKKRKFEDDVTLNLKNDTTNDLRKEIEFTVDIQNKINEIKSNISDKSSEDAKVILRNFQHHVNENAKNMKMKGDKKKVFEKVIINFNVECNKILVHSFITLIFRDKISEKLQTFLKEVIDLKHIKTKNS